MNEFGASVDFELWRTTDSGACVRDNAVTLAVRDQSKFSKVGQQHSAWACREVRWRPWNVPRRCLALPFV